MTTRILPTFLLKGVDPNKLLADYQAGYFSRPIKKKAKITIAQNSVILAPSYATSRNAPVFCIKDRNNCSVIVATTGHADVEVFNSSGGNLPEGGRCEFCMSDFTHVITQYPIAYQEMAILETKDNEDTPTDKLKYRIMYIFWGEGCFCSFECALGYVRRCLAKESNFRDSSYHDCDRMLNNLYKLTHPKAGHLRPAQEPRLLKANKGSLTKEEWENNRHFYVKTNRVLLIPAKVEYIQQNFNNPIVSLDLGNDNTI